MFGCNGEETVLLKVTCRAQVSKGTVQDTGQNFVDFLQITNTAIMQNWIGQFMTWMNSNREDIPIILTDFWWCPGRKEIERDNPGALNALSAILYKETQKRSVIILQISTISLVQHLFIIKSQARKSDATIFSAYYSSLYPAALL